MNLYYRVYRAASKETELEGGKATRLRNNLVLREEPNLSMNLS